MIPSPTRVWSEKKYMQSHFGTGLWTLLQSYSNCLIFNVLRVSAAQAAHTLLGPFGQGSRSASYSQASANVMSVAGEKSPQPKITLYKFTTKNFHSVILITLWKIFLKFQLKFQKNFHNVIKITLWKFFLQHESHHVMENHTM